MNRFWITLLLVTLAACTNRPQPEATAPQPSGVPTERITPTAEQLQQLKLQLGAPRRMKATMEIPITGQLHLPPQNDAQAASVMGGLVHKLNAYIGDQVQAGQVLALLSNPEFIRLQEQFLTLRSQLALQQRETQRQQTLVSQQAGVERLLDEARTQEQVLQARLGSTRLQLEQLGANLTELEQGRMQTYLPVYSPITGTVNEVLVQAGQNVAAQSPLFSVIDSRHLHMELHVFEQDLPRVRTGLVVKVKVEGRDQPLEGRIFSIGRSVNPISRTVRLHAEIVGTPSGLVGGQYLRGILQLPALEVWALPATAVHRWGGAWYGFRRERSNPSAPIYLPIRLNDNRTQEGGFILSEEQPLDSSWVLTGGYGLLSIWKGPQEE